MAQGQRIPLQCRRHGRLRFKTCIRKTPGRRAWQSIPVFLPGEFHRQRSLEGYSPWRHKESDTTEVTKHACKQNESITYEKRFFPEVTEGGKLFSIRIKNRLSYCCCSVAKSSLTLCSPRDCSIPVSSVLFCLLEFAQIHVLWVSDAI